MGYQAAESKKAGPRLGVSTNPCKRFGNPIIPTLKILDRIGMTK